jgi:hypothetical protein
MVDGGEVIAEALVSGTLTGDEICEEFVAHAPIIKSIQTSIRNAAFFITICELYTKAIDTE